jgi:hypothetical protein
VSRGIALPVLDLGARRGGWSAPRPGRLTPGKDPVPIVQEAGWAPESVWTCAKNLAPTGIRSMDRPACSSVAIPTELPGPNLIIYIVLTFSDPMSNLVRHYDITVPEVFPYLLRTLANR